MNTSLVLSGLAIALFSTHVLANEDIFEQADNKIFLAASDCDDVYESCKTSCESLQEQCSNSRNSQQQKACQTKVQRCLEKCESYLQRCSK